jgi:tetratricopeptide (TPR) repeat protein
MISSSNPPRAAAAVAGLAALLSILLVGCGPADPLGAARRLQSLGNFGGSIAPLRQLLEDEPDNAEANFLYGVALIRSGQPSVALWPLRRAAENPEWLVRANLELAASELSSANHDEAVVAATRILEVEPDNVQALLVRSLARSQSRRDYEGALADADRILALDPDNLDALAPRAVALLGLERVEEAEAAIDALDERFREGDLSGVGSERYCVSRGIFANEKGDPEAADRIFTACLEKFPKGVEVTAQAVTFYDSIGRSERSLEILRASLDEEPRNGYVREAIALRLASQGNVEEAEQLLRAGTEIEPPQLAFSGWIALANHYVRQEAYDDGVAALEQAIGLVEQPGPDLVFRYGDTLVMAGRYERAIELAKEIEIPAHREILLGRAYFEQGRWQEALEHLSAGIVYWPDNAVARYYAALAAERLGDIDRAVSEYRYSIRADPGATDARLRIGRLHRAEGLYEEAMIAAGHRGSEVAFDEALELFWIELSAQAGIINEKNARQTLIAGRSEISGDQVAAMAAGAVARRGPGAGVRIIRSIPKLDLTAVENAAALRALVVDLIATDRAEVALATVEPAIAAHPEAGVFHALRGLTLEAGSDTAGARSAFERAIALDSGDPIALSGIARAEAAAGEVDAALASYARAEAAAEDDPEPHRAAAELLVAKGRVAEAEEQLEQLLLASPYDARAALRLAGLQLERNVRSERSLALARMAVRFGGGADAYALLGRVHRQRGEPELAAEAEQRAQALRVAPETDTGS